MKVVTEFVPNYTDPVNEEAEAWYQEALEFMKANAGQWVMVDIEANFHRSRLHKVKFDLFNKWHYGYEVEFRYPATGECVMYGRWPVSTMDKVKRFFK